MSSRRIYRRVLKVVPSGECPRGYKPRAVDCSHLAPRVAASCLAKPSCYTWPACRYSLCCPAWQLVDCVVFELQGITTLQLISNYTSSGLRHMCANNLATVTNNNTSIIYMAHNMEIDSEAPWMKH